MVNQYVQYDCIFQQRVLVSCLLKAAESQHDRFITIIRDSMTKLLLVENDDGEKYWKVSISNNSKLVFS